MAKKDVSLQQNVGFIGIHLPAWSFGYLLGCDAEMFGARELATFRRFYAIVKGHAGAVLVFAHQLSCSLERRIHTPIPEIGVGAVRNNKNMVDNCAE